MVSRKASCGRQRTEDKGDSGNAFLMMKRGQLFSPRRWVGGTIYIYATVDAKPMWFHHNTFHLYSLVLCTLICSLITITESWLIENVHLAPRSHQQQVNRLFATNKLQHTNHKPSSHKIRKLNGLVSRKTSAQFI